MGIKPKSTDELLDELRTASNDAHDRTHKRDWLILQARDRDVPLSQLADITGLSRQTCSNIAWRERGSVDR